MDILLGAIRAMLMIVGIGVVIGLVAALFMVIFNIATGVDEHLQE